MVYAVDDDAQTFPLGDAIETFIRAARTPSASSRRFAATIPSSRVTCGSRSGTEGEGENGAPLLTADGEAT